MLLAFNIFKIHNYPGIITLAAILKSPTPTGIKRMVQQHIIPKHPSINPTGRKITSQMQALSNAPVTLNATPNSIININKHSINVIISSYPSGIIIAAMMYAQTPVPRQRTNTNHINLTNVGSILK